MRWFVVLAVLVGCGGKSSDAPRLVSDEEIATLEASITKRIAENAERRCERPVLRGAATPGKAGPDLAAFDRPSGANLATCLASLDKLDPKDDLSKRTPALLDYEQRCGIELEGLIRKATSHRDACSPFQTGVQQWEHMTTFVRAARVIGLRARLRAEAGDVDGALWLLLDAIRFHHDLSRGHVSLLTSTLVSSMTETGLEDAREMLAASSPVKLDELAKAVDGLLATEPGFGDTLAGETEHAGLFYALPGLKPADWVPPGGWAEGMSRASYESIVKPKSFGDPRDDAGMLLVVTDEVAKAYAAACPTAATYKACHGGLMKLAREGAARAKGNKDVGKVYAELVKRAKGDNAQPAIRATLVEILSGIFIGPAQEYAARRAGAFARLATLRLHLEVLRTKTCTGTEALRSPARLGDALVVKELDGAIEVTPPAWIKSDKPAWRIACPK